MNSFLKIFICIIWLSACNGTPKNETRSIKDVNYESPNALCNGIIDVIDNPPHDMTARQNHVASLGLNACRLESRDITIEIAQNALKDDNFAMTVNEDVLTLFYRSDEPEQRACCSIQPKLPLVGKTDDGNVFAGRYRLKNLDDARLRFFRPNFEDGPISYIGKNAPKDLHFIKDELKGTHSEGVLFSEALDEKRAYQLYTPPGFQKGDTVGVVLLGDGKSLGYYVRQWEPLITSGKVAPFIGIGIASGKNAIIDPKKDYDFDVRNSDYIYEYKRGPQRFDAHLKFVTDELLPHIAKELEVTPTPETTVLMGGSSAGSFAIWGVMKRPDIFGHSVGMSPSPPLVKNMSNLPELAQTRKYYLSAGLYEPAFQANAESYKQTFDKANVYNEIKIYSDGHSSDQRELRMVDALPKIFPVE